MRNRIRLQGSDFRYNKKNLILLLRKTIISKNGNICMVMKDTNEREFEHWLNDEEKEQFISYVNRHQINYIKNWDWLMFLKENKNLCIKN